MLSPNFVIIGVAINFLGGLDYIVKTIKGKIRPNQVTWLLWALAPLIAFLAEVKQGVGIQSLMTFIVGFVPLLIFLASFVNKKSKWRLGRVDLICGALSLLGILLWYITKQGNLAILFSILADGLAATPTILKSYHFPETETYGTYLASVFSGAITLLTINVWNLAYYGFPAYILLVNLLLFMLIKFRLRKLIPSKL